LQGLELWGAEGLRWGIDTPPDRSTPAAEISHIVNFYNTPLHLKGVRFSPSVSMTTKAPNVLIESVFLDSTLDIGNSQKVKNSVFAGGGVTSTTDDSSDSYIDNCIINGRLVVKSGKVTLTNSIIASSSAWLAEFYDGVQVLASNNVFASSATDQFTDVEGNQLGVGETEIQSAFSNFSNEDYSVKQSWADTYLVSKGTEGSDIVYWAYNDSDDPGSVPVNNIYIGSRPVSDVKYFDGVSLKDVNLYINGEIVWST